MTKRFTNAAELARLAGISRERVGQCLASGDVVGVRVLIGLRSAWRIDTKEAERWLKLRGIPRPTWTLRTNHVGAMENIYTGTGT